MNNISIPSLAPPTRYVEQYEAYLLDVGNIGTRYATANGFYLSVITALLGILAFTKGGEVFEGQKAYLGTAVSVFAVLVCMIWSRTVASYSRVFRIKFTVLRQMEQAGNLFPIFEREEELRGKLTLLDNERLIPLVLSLPFLVTLVWSGFRLFR
jgi:hypothetical protein